MDTGAFNRDHVGGNCVRMCVCDFVLTVMTLVPSVEVMWVVTM